MTSSSSPRETIQISLGTSANAITAHLLNLQGLASTSSSSDHVFCDAVTTHYVQGSGLGGGGTLVPRVLLIDQATHQVPASMTTATEGAATNASSLSVNLADAYLTNLHTDSFWNGQIQVLGNDTMAFSTGHQALDPSQSTSPLLKAASSMAYSSHSRYYMDRGNNYPDRQYRTDPSNSRHVVWDDDEEYDEEDPYERLQREQQNERRWRTQTSLALGQELNNLMAENFQEERNEVPLESGQSSAQRFCFNHWTDIWMPPRDEKSKVILPFSSQSQLVPHWNVTYQCNGDSCGNSVPFLREWKEDVLFENVRHMLEACDHGIQGVSIATEGHGIYASLATYLLDELKQECKSAGRLIYHVTGDGKESEKETTSSRKNPRSDDDVSFSAPSSRSWQEAQVDRIRQQICLGLVLNDFTEKAHAVLPLQLPGDCYTGTSGSSSLSWFRSTARVAMALEASTLPFRLNENNTNSVGGCLPAHRIGLQNAPFLASHGSSDSSWGTTASRLTFSEFLQVLQPSSSHSMLELDVLTQHMGNQELYNLIQEGTSVQRDQRMRQSRGHSYRTRPRDVSPGAWMQNRSRGLLSSLSHPSSDKNSHLNLDRTLHHHFALSTSVRPILSLPSDKTEGISMSNYLTCLVQGMGIQYRPERSMATVLNQSLGQLTFGDDGGGRNYGAGIYWKYVVPHVETPVLAVLGNTTRSFAQLNRTANDMKAAMRTPRFRGFYNRDVSNGVLPEMEDCDEALEACFNKRDVYQPPSGSGLDFDEDY